ncbi:two-component system, OmpR family, phosphate regulon sensor histidine kinase PhoR [Bacteroides luti]|uniref:histidine kinase n=1 Tax=Bacteroides luti TaxID=1297750 RepID=A0A1M5H150_9BACE|nr:HAMP domain-containing sensor histidine kinase [Bacteroides luti]SHG09650.1 two-component system, OmpR family, phosphate regulon sensor histidine kinase PhoR [Bacteroides luti]
MNSNYAKFITAIAILFILLLQGLWLYNAYRFVSGQIENKINICLSESNQKEVFARLSIALQSMPKGAFISSDTISGESTSFLPNYVDLQESLVKLNRPLVISSLDSLFSKSLEQSHLKVKYILNKVNPQTGEVIQTTGKNTEELFKGALKSIIIPTNKKNTEGIQVLVISPYKVIFEQMTLMLVGSVLMVLVIGYCIFFQIKIIVRQNKIAQLRQDFTYAMIHDMKTPLSTILMGINMLRSGKLDDKKEKKEKYFEICMDESNHLLTLTNRILTIAKLEQGELKLNKQIVDLKEMIGSLVNKFSINHHKKISFDLSFSDDLTFVVADYEYLKEAISNLIDNSIKYSHNEVKIDISCFKADDKIVIKVRDNGLGIAPKDQAKIFEKFERAAAVGRKGGAAGFGLGLSYVLRVIEAHGGTVSVSSVENDFCEFTISLPVLIEEL